jgi:hypothetical protein
MPRKAEIQWFLVAASCTALTLAAIGLYGQLTEVGWKGFLPGGSTTTSAPTVKLKAQAVYQVKKKLDLLDMTVVRVISKQQPQEFLILDGVSSGLVDKVFAKKVDLGWINLVANQFLKLREGGEGSGNPVSIEVQELRTLSQGKIEDGNSGLPYWHLEIRFKLSNEPNSRYYQAGIVRHANGQSLKASDKDTLLVGYAQKEAFQKALIADLMTQLSFERN